MSPGAKGAIRQNFGYILPPDSEVTGLGEYELGFNPFRMFKRRGHWSRDDYSQWDSPPKSRRKTALTVVGVAVGLFALAVLLLSSPSTNDEDARRASNVSATRVAADSQRQDSAPIPAVSAGQKISAAECSQRRLQLTADSQAVDRFDLSALDVLNKRIGLYNQDCADTNTTAAASAASAGTDVAKATKPGDNTATGKTVVASTAQKPAKQGADSKTAFVAKNGPSDKKPQTANGEAQATKATAEKADGPKWNPTVLSIQSLLKKQGFDPGPTDGLMGRRTRDAVKAFQTRHGLTPDGLVTLELLEQVLEAHPAAGGKSSLSSDSDGQIVKQKKAASVASKQSGLTQTALTPKPGTTTQRTTLGGANGKKKLTIESLNDFERQTIQWVCAGQTNKEDGTSYDDCLQDQISRGRRVGKPDLSKLNNFERRAITRLCANARYEQGLAAYYECAARQRDSVTSIARRPNVNNLGIDVRGAVRRNCDGLQFTESLPVYYRCVDTQIARAKR